MSLNIRQKGKAASSCDKAGLRRLGIITREVYIMANKEVLDRALYKRIKAMDRKTMEAFLNEMYIVGADSVNAVNIDMDALRTDIGQIKGIGESRLDEIMNTINKHLTSE